jgi:endoglucanase
MRLRIGLAVLAMSFMLAGCGGATDRAASERGAEGPSGGGKKGALAGMRFYNDPNSHGRQAAATLRVTGKDELARKVDAKIGSRPTAIWLTPDPDAVYMQARTLTEEATERGQVPVLVAYNLPDRDCGMYSSGGASDIDTYLHWLGSFAAGIGNRKAVVILEPDAIAHSLEGCSGSNTATERYRLLGEAVKILKRQPNAKVYVDAGNASWVEDLGTLADALAASGVGEADGFALNVSNFETTKRSTSYGDELSRRLDGAHFVIDTSRNGAGPPPPAADPASHKNWCNPSSARLGTPPTTQTGHSSVDAYLWVKQPGDSDGSCRQGAPAAGKWWTAYASELMKGTTS